MDSSASSKLQRSKLAVSCSDWERLPGFGIGAQLAGMAGLLAIAIKEKRILVTNYYNRLITMVAMVIVLSALWILI